MYFYLTTDFEHIHIHTGHRYRKFGTSDLNPDTLMEEWLSSVVGEYQVRGDYFCQPETNLFRIEDYVCQREDIPVSFDELQF